MTAGAQHSVTCRDPFTWSLSSSRHICRRLSPSPNGLRVPLGVAVLTLDSVGHSGRGTKVCPRLTRKNIYKMVGSRAGI